MDGDHSVSERPYSVGDMRWSIALLPALAVLVLGSVLILATGSESKRSIPAPEHTLATAPSPDDPAPSVVRVLAKEAQEPREPVVAAHPHPFTPEHQRLAAINQTIQSLNDAMSFRDVKKMRDLVVAYRALDPEDVDQSQLGYLTIADCIEHPGQESLAKARDFYDNQRHSPLRRFVRRICFENRD